MIKQTLLKITMVILALMAGVMPSARCGDAGYPRAILHGDYADPSILRDGADYYMTHSPFVYTPGFLIWHSRDLVNWQPVCRAMSKVVGPAMAPDLVKHDGKFYIYFPAAGKNRVIRADRIDGPWSDPIQLDVGQIDPGHAIGEDGKRYLFLSEGFRIRLSGDGLKVIGEKEKVCSGWDYPAAWKTEGRYLESPKIIRKGEWFYMVSAEGGTAGPPTSHMCVVARSKSINGPWENSPRNPLIHTYSANESWWSKGHGTLIDDVNGNWWIVYHAYANDAWPLGRQTLIDPIGWTDDGWPVLDKTARPLPASDDGTGGLTISDDFSGEKPGWQWTGWREYDPNTITLKDHSLRLAGRGATPADARLLLATAMDRSYEIQVEVTLTQGSVGGLVLFYNEKAFAGVSSDGKQFTVYKDAGESIQRPDESGGRFFLKIVNRGNHCEMLASGDGKAWTTLHAGVDVSGMHHNTFKGFLALRPGLMAAGQGEVRFERFQYRRFP